MPFLPPGHVPNPGIEPQSLVSPTLQVDALLLEPFFFFKFFPEHDCKEERYSHPGRVKMGLQRGRMQGQEQLLGVWGCV